MATRRTRGAALDAIGERVRLRLPRIAQALEQLQALARAPGALNGRETQLVALGITLALRPDTDSLRLALSRTLEAGLTHQEIVECLAVSLAELGAQSATVVERALELLTTLSHEEQHAQFLAATAGRASSPAPRDTGART